MKSSIHFFTEDLVFTLREKTKIRKWIESCIKQEGADYGEICIIFCSDTYLSRINRKYLKHNTLTDIITFPLMEIDSVISGDIFISLTRVRENSIIFQQRIKDEINRVIIHGILHLLGYDDNVTEDIIVMREKENFYLSKLV